jgi:hypothetical protein
MRLGDGCFLSLFGKKVSYVVRMFDGAIVGAVAAAACKGRAWADAGSHTLRGEAGRHLLLDGWRGFGKGELDEIEGFE